MPDRQTIPAKCVAAQHIGRTITFSEILGETISGELLSIDAGRDLISLAVPGRSALVYFDTPIYFDLRHD